MSMGLLANQGFPTKRGGGALEPVFWQVDDDLLGPKEDLCFSKREHRGPKSGSALSNYSCIGVTERRLL